MVKRKTIGKLPENRHARKRAYLKALEQTGAVTVASDAASIDRKMPSEWREKDAEFADAEQVALSNFADRLEKEAVRRAIKGVRKKKFTGKGEPVEDPETGEQYIEREYSDTLLIFMLKGARPDKYKYRLDVRVSKEEQELDRRFTDLVAAAATGGKGIVAGEEGTGDLRIEADEPAAPAPAGLPGPDV